METIDIKQALTENAGVLEGLMEQNLFPRPLWTFIDSQAKKTLKTDTNGVFYGAIDVYSNTKGKLSTFFFCQGGDNPVIIAGDKTLFSSTEGDVGKICVYRSNANVILQNCQSKHDYLAIKIYR